VRTLPPIALNQHDWRLPLVDDSVLQLAAAILNEDPQQRSELLQALLRDDPALSLWCVCSSWAHTELSIETLPAAARWLDQAGMVAIVQDAREQPVAQQFQRCVRCVRESARRRLLSEVRSEDDAGGTSRDVLAALLSNLWDWLDATGVPRDASGSVLPPWLAKTAGDNECPPCEAQTAEVAKKVDATAAQIAAAWQAEHPRAWQIFQQAYHLWQRVSQYEARWDEQFLREKLASLKEFTYGASHELNNPLFNISSRAQVLLRDEVDPERRRKLSTIYAHAMRASEMINDIALAARPPKPNRADVDAVAIVREVVAELNAMAQEQGAELRLQHADSALPLEADEVQLAVAVREVVINALEAVRRTAKRGEVTVEVAAGADQHVEITVADNGPGLDARAQRHLFDPFFSGYESGRGLGFGLTKCWQIVQAHGGTIAVDSQVNRGCTMTIRLPNVQSAKREAGKTSSASNAHSGS